jgi:8-oxo-dGTP pyrophosphatase MutT (NUDIX family)
MFSLEEASCRAAASTGLPAGRGGSEFRPKWPELSLRSGVVPFRVDADNCLRIPPYPSPGTSMVVAAEGRLVPGRTLAQSAALEAYEEAGIRGEIGSTPLGSYQYCKTDRKLLGPPQLVELVLFSLKVEIEEDSWPERGIRQRRWFGQEHAPHFVAPGPLRDLLRDYNSQFMF